MADGFKWFGEEWEKLQTVTMRRRLNRAGITVSRFAKERLSLVGKRSPFGTYPYKQTGHLRRNVLHELDSTGMGVRWGTNVIYGRILQLYKNRPWMSLTNQETQGEINRILGERII